MLSDILILECTPIICELLRKALHRRGISATCVDDPLEMISLWLERIDRGKPFSTIFIDGNMPMSLFTIAVASIRSIEQNLPKRYRVPPVRIIATTTRPWFGREDGRKIGVDDVVLKPMNVDEWEELIRSQSGCGVLDLVGP